MDDKTVYSGVGNKGAWWRKITRLTVVIPVVAVLSVVAGVLVFLNMRSTTSNNETAYEAAVKAADAAWSTGDYEKSLSQLENVTGDAKTKEQKVELYTNLASAAASSGDIAKALEYLGKKHEAYPSTANADAYIEGTYYERMGDTKKAIEKYKIALEYVKKSDESTARNMDISGLKERITYLEGQQ